MVMVKIVKERNNCWIKIMYSRILSSRNGRFLLVLFLAIFTKLLFSRKINIKLGFNHVRLYRFSMIMKHLSHSSSPRMTRKSIKSPVGVTLLAGGYPILLSYSNKTSINKLWIWSTHLKTAYFLSSSKHKSDHFKS